MSDSINKLFLNDFHLNYGAKFVNFHNYIMPINYTKGIIKEHLHTRKSIGLFDVSHMGKILIPYNDTNCISLEKFIPLDLKILNVNNSKYAFLLNERGGIIDDIIISKIELDGIIYFYIVYNSSRKNIDESIFINETVNFKIMNEYCLLSLQGPLSSKIIYNFFSSANSLKFMDIKNFKFKENNIIISRSGYTGEDGFELTVPNNIAEEFINELINFEEIMLCGLGCRDSLRMEAGLCLYGNELLDNITPVQANLTWAISKKRLKEKNFNGYDKIIKDIEDFNILTLVGIKCLSKSILRSKMKLYEKDNNNIGFISSGGFSPSLDISIALAYIDNSFLSNNKKVFCSIRNKNEEVLLVKLPFIQHKYKR